MRRRKKKEKDPIIGYRPVDGEHYIMKPPEALTGEAYHSVDRVAERVAEYGRAEDLKGMNPVKLGDILDIVIQEMSDLLLDGRAARRLVKACQAGGLPYDERLGERIDIGEKEAIYSSFQILGMRVELL